MEEELIEKEEEQFPPAPQGTQTLEAVSYTHLRAHET